MSNEMAVNDRLDVQENVTLLGDWFCAEAVSAAIGLGFRQTNFTRHAPSMGARIALFGQEFAECLAHRGWRAEESRERAIQELQTTIERVEEEHDDELALGKEPMGSKTDDVEPICPFCEEVLERLLLARQDGSSTNQAHCCPHCGKVLGTGHG
jgi:hypothetical protein